MMDIESGWKYFHKTCLISKNWEQENEPARSQVRKISLDMFSSMPKNAAGYK